MHLSHCRSKLDRNRHLCRTWFLHCWSRCKRLQTANSSQRLPQPKYHCYNTVLSNIIPTIQLGEVTVYLFTIRDERPPTVDIRHQKTISLHKTVHFQTTFQNIDVQRNVLETTCQRYMSIIHLVCDVPALCPLQLPTIKIGISCCKCDHIFARRAGQIKRLSRSETKSVGKTCSPGA